MSVPITFDVNDVPSISTDTTVSSASSTTQTQFNNALTSLQWTLLNNIPEGFSTANPNSAISVSQYLGTLVNLAQQGVLTSGMLSQVDALLTSLKEASDAFGTGLSLTLAQDGSLIIAGNTLVNAVQPETLVDQLNYWGRYLAQNNGQNLFNLGVSAFGANAGSGGFSSPLNPQSVDVNALPPPPAFSVGFTPATFLTPSQFDSGSADSQFQTDMQNLETIYKAALSSGTAQFTPASQASFLSTLSDMVTVEFGAIGQPYQNQLQQLIASFQEASQANNLGLEMYVDGNGSVFFSVANPQSGIDTSSEASAATGILNAWGNYVFNNPGSAPFDAITFANDVPSISTDATVPLATSGADPNYYAQNQFNTSLNQISQALFRAGNEGNGFNATTTQQFSTNLSIMVYLANQGKVTAEMLGALDTILTTMQQASEAYGTGLALTEEPGVQVPMPVFHALGLPNANAEGLAIGTSLPPGNLVSITQPQAATDQLNWFLFYLAQGTNASTFVSAVQANEFFFSSPYFTNIPITFVANDVPTLSASATVAAANQLSSVTSDYNNKYNEIRTALTSSLTGFSVANANIFLQDMGKLIQYATQGKLTSVQLSQVDTILTAIKQGNDYAGTELFMQLANEVISNNVIPVLALGSTLPPGNPLVTIGNPDAENVDLLNWGLRAFPSNGSALNSVFPNLPMPIFFFNDVPTTSFCPTVATATQSTTTAFNNAIVAIQQAIGNLFTNGSDINVRTASDNTILTQLGILASLAIFGSLTSSQLAQFESILTAMKKGNEQYNGSNSLLLTSTPGFYGFSISTTNGLSLSQIISNMLNYGNLVNPAYLAAAMPFPPPANPYAASPYTPFAIGTVALNQDPTGKIINYNNVTPGVFTVVLSAPPIAISLATLINSTTVGYVSPTDQTQFDDDLQDLEAQYQSTIGSVSFTDRGFTQNYVAITSMSDTARNAAVSDLGRMVAFVASGNATQDMKNTVTTLINTIYAALTQSGVPQTSSNPYAFNRIGVAPQNLELFLGPNGTLSNGQPDYKLLFQIVPGSQYGQIPLNTSDQGAAATQIMNAFNQVVFQSTPFFFAANQPVPYVFDPEASSSFQVPGDYGSEVLGIQSNIGGSLRISVIYRPSNKTPVQQIVDDIGFDSTNTLTPNSNPNSIFSLLQKAAVEFLYQNQVTPPTATAILNAVNKMFVDAQNFGSSNSKLIPLEQIDQINKILSSLQIAVSTTSPARDLQNILPAFTSHPPSTPLSPSQVQADINSWMTRLQTVAPDELSPALPYSFLTVQGLAASGATAAVPGASQTLIIGIDSQSEIATTTTISVAPPNSTNTAAQAAVQSAFQGYLNDINSIISAVGTGSSLSSSQKTALGNDFLGLYNLAVTGLNGTLLSKNQAVEVNNIFSSLLALSGSTGPSPVPAVSTVITPAQVGPPKVGAALGTISSAQWLNWINAVNSQHVSIIGGTQTLAIGGTATDIVPTMSTATTSAAVNTQFQNDIYAILSTLQTASVNGPDFSNQDPYNPRTIPSTFSIPTIDIQQVPIGLSPAQITNLGNALGDLYYLAKNGNGGSYLTANMAQQLNTFFTSISSIKNTAGNLIAGQWGIAPSFYNGQNSYNAFLSSTNGTSEHDMWTNWAQTLFPNSFNNLLGTPAVQNLVPPFPPNFNLLGPFNSLTSLGAIGYGTFLIPVELNNVVYSNDDYTRPNTTGTTDDNIGFGNFVPFNTALSNVVSILQGLLAQRDWSSATDFSALNGALNTFVFHTGLSGADQSWTLTQLNKINTIISSLFANAQTPSDISFPRGTGPGGFPIVTSFSASNATYQSWLTSLSANPDALSPAIPFGSLTALSLFNIAGAGFPSSMQLTIGAGANAAPAVVVPIGPPNVSDDAQSLYQSTIQNMTSILQDILTSPTSPTATAAQIGNIVTPGTLSYDIYTLYNLAVAGTPSGSFLNQTELTQLNTLFTSIVNPTTFFNPSSSQPTVPNITQISVIDVQNWITDVITNPAPLTVSAATPGPFGNIDLIASEVLAGKQTAPPGLVYTFGNQPHPITTMYGQTTSDAVSQQYTNYLNQLISMVQVFGGFGGTRTLSTSQVAQLKQILGGLISLANNGDGDGHYMTFQMEFNMDVLLKRLQALTGTQAWSLPPNGVLSLGASSPSVETSQLQNFFLGLINSPPVDVPPFNSVFTQSRNAPSPDAGGGFNLFFSGNQFAVNLPATTFASTVTTPSAGTITAFNTARNALQADIQTIVAHRNWDTGSSALADISTQIAALINLVQAGSSSLTQLNQLNAILESMKSFGVLSPTVVNNTITGQTLDNDAAIAWLQHLASAPESLISVFPPGFLSPTTLVQGGFADNISTIATTLTVGHNITINVPTGAPNVLDSTAANAQEQTDIDNITLALQAFLVNKSSPAGNGQISASQPSWIFQTLNTAFKDLANLAINGKSGYMNASTLANVNTLFQSLTNGGPNSVSNVSDSTWTAWASAILNGRGKVFGDTQTPSNLYDNTTAVNNLITHGYFPYDFGGIYTVEPLSGPGTVVDPSSLSTNTIKATNTYTPTAADIAVTKLLVGDSTAPLGLQTLIELASVGVPVATLMPQFQQVYIAMIGLASNTPPTLPKLSSTDAYILNKAFNGLVSSDPRESIPRLTLWDATTIANGTNPTQAQWERFISDTRSETSNATNFQGLYASGVNGITNPQTAAAGLRDNASIAAFFGGSAVTYATIKTPSMDPGDLTAYTASISDLAFVLQKYAIGFPLTTTEYNRLRADFSAILTQAKTGKLDYAHLNNFNGPTAALLQSLGSVVQGWDENSLLTTAIPDPNWDSWLQTIFTSLSATSIDSAFPAGYLKGPAIAQALTQAGVGAPWVSTVSIGGTATKIVTQPTMAPSLSTTYTGYVNDLQLLLQEIDIAVQHGNPITSYYFQQLNQDVGRLVNTAQNGDGNENYLTPSIAATLNTLFTSINSNVTGWSLSSLTAGTVPSASQWTSWLTALFGNTAKQDAITLFAPGFLSAAALADVLNFFSLVTVDVAGQPTPIFAPKTPDLDPRMAAIFNPAVNTIKNVLQGITSSGGIVNDTYVPLLNKNAGALIKLLQGDGLGHYLNATSLIHLNQFLTALSNVTTSSTSWAVDPTSNSANFTKVQWQTLFNNIKADAGQLNGFFPIHYLEGPFITMNLGGTIIGTSFTGAQPSQDISDLYQSAINGIQNILKASANRTSPSPALLPSEETTLNADVGTLLNLALNGLNGSFLSNAWDQNVSVLINSLVGAGATSFTNFSIAGIPNTTPPAFTLTNMPDAIWQAWRSLALSSNIIQSIFTVDIRPSNRSIQAMVELEYVRAGNQMLSDNLTSLQNALKTTQNVLDTLTGLQNLHNQIVVSGRSQSFSAFLASRSGYSTDYIGNINSKTNSAKVQAFYSAAATIYFGQPITPQLSVPNTYAPANTALGELANGFLGPTPFLTLVAASTFWKGNMTYIGHGVPDNLDVLKTTPGYYFGVKLSGNPPQSTLGDLSASARAALGLQTAANLPFGVKNTSLPNLSIYIPSNAAFWHPPGGPLGLFFAQNVTFQNPTLVNFLNSSTDLKTAGYTTQLVNGVNNIKPPTGDLYRQFLASMGFTRSQGLQSVLTKILLQKNQIIGEIASLSGQSPASITDPNSLYGQLKTILNDMNATLVVPGGGAITAATSYDDAFQGVSNWLLDNYNTTAGQAGASKPGGIQQNITFAVTAAQSLNDRQKQNVSNFLFVFEEFQKSAAAILQQLTQIIEEIAKHISG